MRTVPNPVPLVLNLPDVGYLLRRTVSNMVHRPTSAPQAHGHVRHGLTGAMIESY